MKAITTYGLPCVSSQAPSISILVIAPFAEYSGSLGKGAAISVPVAVGVFVGVGVSVGMWVEV